MGLQPPEQRPHTHPPVLPCSPGPGPGTMSEKSVEAAAELSAKVRAGTAAAWAPRDPRAPHGRVPQAAPDGPTLPWRRIPADPHPPSPPTPLPSLALPTQLGAPPASAL